MLAYGHRSPETADDGRLRAPPRRLHRSDNIGIRAAATDVAAHAFTHRVVILPAGLLEQRHRRHDLSRRAVPTLEPIMLEERRLHRMQISMLRQPFDCRNLIALMHD